MILAVPPHSGEEMIPGTHPGGKSPGAISEFALQLFRLTAKAAVLFLRKAFIIED